jgi:hypothetical protein
MSKPVLLSPVQVVGQQAPAPVAPAASIAPLETLARDIVNRLDLAQQAEDDLQLHLQAAGKMLLEVKANCPRGQFMQWRRRHIVKTDGTPYSDDRCEQAMNIARGKTSVAEINAKVADAKAKSKVAYINKHCIEKSSKSDAVSELPGSRDVDPGHDTADPVEIPAPPPASAKGKTAAEAIAIIEVLEGEELCAFLKWYMKFLPELSKRKAQYEASLTEVAA